MSVLNLRVAFGVARSRVRLRRIFHSDLSRRDRLARRLCHAVIRMNTLAFTLLPRTPCTSPNHLCVHRLPIPLQHNLTLQIKLSTAQARTFSIPSSRTAINAAVSDASCAQQEFAILLCTCAIHCHKLTLHWSTSQRRAQVRAWLWLLGTVHMGEVTKKIRCVSHCHAHDAIVKRTAVALHLSFRMCVLS